MHRGYIKIWRKLEDSGLLQMHGTLALFIHILLKATHKPTKIGTPIGVVELDRGQYISGRHKLASAVGLTEREIRTCLSRLEELDILSIKTTSKYSIYTIVNYGNYQDCDQLNDQQTTGNSPTNDQQTTTKQTHKHINTKEDKTIVPSKAVDACPHEKIIELYHSTLPTMPSVKIWTPKRSKLLQARWREDTKRQDVNYWERFFGYVSQSDFLCGRTEKPFNCDLEWMLNASNFVKIIEGKYHAG